MPWNVRRIRHSPIDPCADSLWSRVVSNRWLLLVAVLASVAANEIGLRAAAAVEVQLYPLTGEVRLFNPDPTDFEFVFYELKSDVNSFERRARQLDIRSPTLTMPAATASSIRSTIGSNYRARPTRFPKPCSRAPAAACPRCGRSAWAIFGTRKSCCPTTSSRRSLTPVFKPCRCQSKSFSRAITITI